MNIFSVGITPTAAGAERRVMALDGLRGMMTILVVVSHYFGELPHGISALMFGWIAVDMFYVLSGYLIGRLILEKGHHDNFFSVFYLRRICRTLPIYFFCVILILLISEWIGSPAWLPDNVEFPSWSYFTLTQNMWMAATGSIGSHWLAPTWTLAVEEQFYLVAPAIVLMLPRRYLIHALAGGMLIGVLCRWSIIDTSYLPRMAAHTLLPANADILVAGLLAAVLIKTSSLPWAALDRWIRLAPIAMIAALIALRIVEGEGDWLFPIFADLFVSTACAIYILSLVRGTPEARRYESKVLCFFGNISYAVYLTHLPILGLMHGFILDATPDLANAAQLAVTLASIPLCVAISWVLTKIVEEPITNFGRSFKWSGKTREVAAPQGLATT
jgi:peptidoglycan/LPS O-acetylase OafA/YrhL